MVARAWVSTGTVHGPGDKSSDPSRNRPIGSRSGGIRGGGGPLPQDLDPQPPDTYPAGVGVTVRACYPPERPPMHPPARQPISIGTKRAAPGPRRTYGTSVSFMLTCHEAVSRRGATPPPLATRRLGSPFQRPTGGGAGAPMGLRPIPRPR